MLRIAKRTGKATKLSANWLLLSELMAEFIKVANLDELKPDEVKAVNVGGVRIALYRLANEVFATSDICTHAGCLFSESGYVQKREVECGCHSSRFDIKTGQVVQEPAVEAIKVYPVKIESGSVLVEI
jgi:nitrite reductase/ring-hydroxylating ferredoxin subunit